MNRSLPLVCALLLLSSVTVAFLPVAGNPGNLGATAGVQPAPTTGPTATVGPPPEPTNGSVARMMVSNVARTNRSTVQPDLTTALSSSADEVADEVGTTRIQREFDGLSSNEKRQKLLIRALISLEERSVHLVERHRQSIEGYANGSIGERELFRRLAVIDKETRQVDDRLDRVGSLIVQADAEYLFSRITTIRNRLRGIQNPLQRQMAANLAANSQLPPIHVEVGDDSIVLATIIDGEYIRTSYFHDYRNTSGPFELDTQGDAVERAEQYYPWAWDVQHSFSTGGDQFGDVFVARSNHNHGQLMSYLDMHSGNVYKEYHELSLSEIPTRPGPEATDGGFRVVLQRTYPGGPMAVEVYDVATGERVDARVSLDGGPFRKTGDDGRRWIVEPRLVSSDSSYTIRVVKNSQSITITVSADQQSASGT